MQDLWQGIDFSRSKAEARVDVSLNFFSHISSQSYPVLYKYLKFFESLFFQGSTGVKFSDVAGIDEAVEELQEVSVFPS